MAAPIPRRSVARRKLARGILWVLIIGLALALRAAPIRGAWPYPRYIDEAHVIHHAIELLQKQTLDTGYYNYPSLPSYLLAGAIMAYAPYYTAKHGRDFWSELQQDRSAGTSMAAYYDFISPPRLLVVARRLVLLFSVGNVILAGVLAGWLGGPRAGLLALLLTAFCPALVSRAAIMTVDPIATFFALATLCFCQRLQVHATGEKSRAWRFAAAAGISAGLAITSKYMAGAVYAGVLGTIWLTRATPKQKAQLTAISALGLLVASFLTMPPLLYNLPGVWRTISDVAGYYGTISYGTSYWRDALSLRELGVPLVITGLLGLALLIQRSRATRIAAIAWLAFGLVLVVGVGRTSFQPFRNLLPIVPPLCVAAAFVLARGDLWFAQPRTRKLVNDWVEPMLAFLIMFSVAVPAWREIERQRGVVDTRVAALNWLQQNTRAEDRIVAIQELGVHPAEWRRIGRKPRVLTWFEAGDAITSGEFDYLVASDFSLQFASDEEVWAQYRERWNGIVASLQQAHSLGAVPCPVNPGVWRTNDQRIIILRPR
ncbi:MAG TPA: phospholipid carrier-dependent glycosyltransferase [Chthoniobacterales bacterium]|nr:phospholipid carrier-dependent glycosyltransferase [Chthoniobacterales bacterium]